MINKAVLEPQSLACVLVSNTKSLFLYKVQVRQKQVNKTPDQGPPIFFL
jgi:hypothetical protein